jgi:hypothetical protein
MGNANRIYLKFEGLDWDDDQSIDTFARSLHSGLADLMDPDREFRLQERDENEGVVVRVSKDK